MGSETIGSNLREIIGDIILLSTRNFQNISASDGRGEIDVHFLDPGDPRLLLNLGLAKVGTVKDQLNWAHYLRVELPGNVSLDLFEDEEARNKRKKIKNSRQ
jgi:hypothetical protein